MVYEVEFKANGTEYDYDIDTETGKIIPVDKNVDGDWRMTKVEYISDQYIP